jgi:hypothetical protein
MEEGEEVEKEPQGGVGGGREGKDVVETPLENSRADVGEISIEGLPIPIRALPVPPDQSLNPDTAPKPPSTVTLKIITHLPSRIATWVFGAAPDGRPLKLGIVAKKYRHRADDICLSPDELELTDDAFGKPLQGFVKLLGLADDDLAMIVVAVMVLGPRVGVIVEEESKNSTVLSDLKAAMTPPAPPDMGD